MTDPDEPGYSQRALRGGQGERRSGQRLRATSLLLTTNDAAEQRRRRRL